MSDGFILIAVEGVFSVSAAISTGVAENPRLGIAMMVVSTVLFSILWCFVKALSERYPMAEVSFFRNLFGLVPVLLLVVTHGGSRNLHPHRPLGHVWRAVIGLTSMVLGFQSYHMMRMADAVAISFTAPLLVTALSVPLLGERVGIPRWSAVVVGFAGVLVIVQPGRGMFDAGALIALAAAFAGSLAQVTIRQLNKTDQPITIVFYFTFLSTVFTALPLPFVWVTPSAGDWGWLLLMGLAGGSGQYFMTRAFSLAPAAVISPFNYVSLIWASLLAWLLWAEVPPSHVFTGALIVVASGLFILWREIRKGA